MIVSPNSFKILALTQSVVDESTEPLDIRVAYAHESLRKPEAVPH